MMYKHYIRLDSEGYIIHGFSDAFEQAEAGDICIDGNAYRHFQINGSTQLFGARCRPLYKYAGGQVIREDKPLTIDQKLTPIREKRGVLLSQTDYIVNRQIEESDLVKANKISKAKLTNAEYLQWLEYRQALRDLPATVNVDNPVYPLKPIIGGM